MPEKVRKLKSFETVTPEAYNALVDTVNALTNFNVSGVNAKLTKTNKGSHLEIRESSSATQVINIAKVVSDAAGGGGGYYNCLIQQLDATDWDTTEADQLDDIGVSPDDEVVVLNLPEIGTSNHSLIADDIIKCWYIVDDEGNERLVGTAIISPRAMIAEVDSASGGNGGYYNCHLQSLDATDWNSATADQIDDIGGSVVVLNLAEIPVAGDTASHELSAGDKIPCWYITDDEGNVRLVGIAALRMTSITVVTDVDVNGASSIITKKTRANVLVLGTDAESGDTTIHTGTVC